jgi:diguanylate cyclase (GGDEF)-like protein
MAAISDCRARQDELSVILLEIEDYDDLLLTKGPDRMMQVTACLRQITQSLSDNACECMVVGDGRVAVILPGCERQQAVNLARVLSDAAPTWLCKHGKMDTPLSLSAGVASLATPTRSSRPEDLISAADRCLFAAKGSGGSVVKSIDVL